MWLNRFYTERMPEVKIDPRLLVSRERGDSPFVTFPARCDGLDGACALPIGHLVEHISIADAWDVVSDRTDGGAAR